MKVTLMLYVHIWCAVSALMSSDSCSSHEKIARFYIALDGSTHPVFACNVKHVALQA